MRQWFKRVSKPTISERGRGIIKENKSIKDLQIKDDVYIIIDNTVYKGWILSKNKKLLQIYLWDLNEDIIVRYTDENVSVLNYDKDKFLVINENEISNYLK